jgi:hypothetical protein
VQARAKRLFFSWLDCSSGEQVLYICPVLYDVYQLRTSAGPQDEIEVVRAGPRSGILVIKPRFFNSPNRTLTAELRHPETGVELLTALENVKVICANHRGLVIEGTQTAYSRPTQKAKRVTFVQRWLCKSPGQKIVLDTAKILKRSAARLNSALATGFSPADDDA